MISVLLTRIIRPLIKPPKARNLRRKNQKNLPKKRIIRKRRKPLHPQKTIVVLPRPLRAQTAKARLQMRIPTHQKVIRIVPSIPILPLLPHLMTHIITMMTMNMIIVLMMTITMMTAQKKKPIIATLRAIHTRTMMKAMMMSMTETMTGIVITQTPTMPMA